MELRFPRASRSLHIPSILPSIPDTYFWLVVVWKIINWQLPKAKAPHISLFFLSFHLVTQKDGTMPPHTIQPGPASSPTSPLSRPPTVRRLLCLAAYRQPPKAKTLPSSLLFDGACVCAPNKGTNSGAA